MRPQNAYPPADFKQFWRMAMSQPNDVEPDERDDAEETSAPRARSRSARGKASRFASKAARAAESYTEQLGDDMREQAERLGRQQQDRIESYINALRAAIDAGSQYLEEDGYATSARFARMAADQIDGLNERVHESDIGHYIRSLEGIIRARPMITLGAAALLGFAAIQLFKGNEAPRRRTSTRH
jgi:hypothetical protein